MNNKSILLLCMLLFVSLIAGCISSDSDTDTTPAPTTSAPTTTAPSETTQAPTTTQIPTTTQAPTTAPPAYEKMDHAWPMARHGPASDAQTGMDLPSSPSLAWANTLLADTPVVEYGNVYTFVRVLDDERIFSLCCFDLDDGSLVWSTPASGASQNMSFYSAPAVGDGKVLIVREATEAVHLTAYDAMTGEGVWNYELSPTYKSFLSPVIVDDAVYMAQGPFLRDSEVARHCTIIRLDLATGEEVWTRTLDEPAASHAAFEDDMLFVTGIRMYDGRTYISALDASTGNVVWSENIANEAYDMSCPVIIDGNVYVAVGANNAEYSYITRIICYDAETGDHLWTTTQDDSYHSGWHVFAAGGDFVIPTVMSGETTFTAYDAASGDVAWRHTFGDVMDGTSSTGDTIVCTWTSNPFAGTEDYDMHIGLFDIASRRFVETYTESMPSAEYWVSSWMPALAGDSIVVCLGAKLMCYR